MKKVQKYIFLTILVLFISCKTENKNENQFTKKQTDRLNLKSTESLKSETDSITKVDLNPFLKKQSFNFDSIIDNIKLIPLETLEKSLLDNILKIIVTDSNIYVHDDFKGGGIVIFDNQGKFVKRIDNGKGPGELFRLYDIDYDKIKNELIAYQFPFLMFYNPMGKFIKQERLPLGAYNFLTIPNGYIFKGLDSQGNGHLGNLKNNTLLITDKNFKLKSVGMPYPESNLNFGGYNYLYKNNSIYITERYNDTIYQYFSSSNKLKASYALNFSTKKLPEKYTEGNKDNFKKAIRQNDYYFYLGEYLDTEYHHVFFLENWYKGLKTVIYRDKLSGNLIGGTNFLFDKNDIPFIGFPKSVSNKHFISWYYPSKNDLFSTNSITISDKDKSKIKNLSASSNPVLVFFKLKSF